MSKIEQLPRLRFASRVSREHGEQFVSALQEILSPIGALAEASSVTGIIEWPDVERDALTPAQKRYYRIEDEIVERAFDAVRPALAEAFVRSARAVLARERRRQRE